MVIKDKTALLETANKEMESFSYSVSHDLRTPLRAIDGYSRMILKRKADEFDEETRRQFQIIRDNTQTMGQLIDAILNFSHLGRQAMTLSEINMDSLFREVWEELVTINPGRRLILKIGHLPPAEGDCTLMRQVITNILANAIKFTKDRNEALIEIGSHVKENENVYCIRDNGAGFDMQYYDKLFTVFHRLHNNIDFEGTGIGLAIVQRIINRHSGHVWAEGIVNGGATFYFSLPGRSRMSKIG